MTLGAGRSVCGVIAVCISSVFVLSGCSTLPAFGPSSDAIVGAAKHREKILSESAGFQLVDVSPSTLPALPHDQAQEFPERLLVQKFLSSNQAVMPSDSLVIRIWEAADDGLFAAGGQRETEFVLKVSNGGTIDLPYAGTISVVGKSVQEIREILLERYRGIAIDPEINVEIKETSLRGVAVLGAVVSPGLIPIPERGVKLLDVIALAGGIPHPDWEVTVNVRRRNLSASLGLEHVLGNPSNNVVILPDDNVTVSHVPRRFAVYGAIAKPGNVSLNTPSPRLADLLADSGGLNDMQAAAGSVFVFRIPGDNNQTDAIAYRLDFSRPDAFIMASQFNVVSSDIVYVAASDASELRKFFTTLLSPLLGGASSARNL